MCLLALLYRVTEDAPLVVGANREEAYRRGGEPPAVRTGPCRWVGGVDPLAGGTWLGVNEHGVLAAVTNRRTARRVERPRSRGLLARDLLGLPTASAAAAKAARELDGGRYEGCNIVCADARDVVVLQAGDWLRVRPLPPGIHVLTNGDVNDERDERLMFVAHLLHQEERRCRTSADWAAVLRRLCGRREPDEPPVCLRGEDRGTVSSAVIALRPSLAESVYLHAQGPPDRTPYKDYSELLRQMASGAA
jgi:uncharacterized protein with NRDE domain